MIFSLVGTLLFHTTALAHPTERDGAVLIRLGGEVLSETSNASNATPPPPPPKPITLDLVHTDIREVIRLFTEHSGQNILLSDGISGTVSAQLNNVPWTLALQSIAQSNGWVLTAVGEIWIISKPVESSK